jgi:hypothetical protein
VLAQAEQWWKKATTLRLRLEFCEHRSKAESRDGWAGHQKLAHGRWI